VGKHALGRHVLAELYDCPPEKLNDVQRLRHELASAATAAGAEVVESFFHQFAPHGVSGVVVISESHLAIHTWPEYGYAALDVFTCGQTIDPWISCRHVKDRLSAGRMTTREVARGIFPAPLRHKAEADDR
jgi:S-adenosylmethionine decarboxylase proenzyme